MVTFSPGTDGKNLIKSQLSSATRSLDICVFTINDISTVIASAHGRGIKVRVVTDDQKRFDAGSDIDMLVRWGVPVRMDTSEPQICRYRRAKAAYGQLQLDPHRSRTQLRKPIGNQRPRVGGAIYGRI